MNVTLPFEGIGASVRRKEDLRFLSGRGQYTDDMNRPGQLHAWILRSPHAHARIDGIDTAAAAAMPGVAAIYTARDIEAAGLGGIPCGWQVTGKGGKVMAEPMHPVLASGKVRHVGDPVAVVIAESKAQARDAAEAIEVRYTTLPALSTMAAALAPGAAALHDDAADNICFDWEIGDAAATDAAFARAHKVVRFETTNNRLVPNAMEPRAALGDYDPNSGEHTLITTSQNPHVIRLLMGAFVLKVPEHKLRVVAPDVGGGFGSKIYHYAEEAIVTWAAAQLKRPVKWTAERTESFLSDAHGRDHVTTAELALDQDGTFLGLRVSTLANMGAYLSTFAPAVPTYLSATLLAGVYRTPAIHGQVKAVFTSTVPVDAYRGAGRPETTYLLERLVDVAAREMGMDRLEIRRRNFIRPDQFPYQTPVALQYDSGDYEATLKGAMEAADYAGFEARRAEARARGKLRGIGISTYLEACGIAPSKLVGSLGARAGLYEVANIRVHPTGSISVFTGTHSHGQGHETTFAQLVSEQLGVPLSQVEIVHGDTSRIPFGMGTYGSRSLAVGGAAMVKAMDKIIAKGKKIAAHLLEASVEDIEFDRGTFRVAGTDRAKTLTDISMAAYVPHNYPIDEIEPGLEETAFYDPKNFTYPGGCHICEVEIDPDTGEVAVVNFTACDDVGRVINPMIVEGQIQGGLAQGIGQALIEHTAYDADGQLLTASFNDYAMPRAADLPGFAVSTATTLCTHNPLGVKGCGEVGAIGSPPAVINAVVDALRDHGVTHVEMPATPLKIWSIIHGKGAAQRQPQAAE
ncbi:xanthine dehydrogenase family protein molybdopterin-binding subunit [Pseudoroseomonas cervicalis]|uniref:xanthine dehydrogenase family protein molybdopterin-binding subunit n=1 Tax=Teichococcus cervicalis TaxID=204525 RepID=UPI00278A64FC|nr:xanthine dehydrogenase family protein molybdopterin-binding subunit [Pseudoroseomonas cervicalis]MDQ1079385.1 carbon-monoxide dehydrogenase large subunit [Pseudoroseomonas cervicalis]